jgi:choice-of-anchor C domain-containing protein
MRTDLARRALAVAVVLGLAGAARANLITNGSFELGVNAPTSGYSTLPAGSTDLTGWTVLGAGVDWVHNSFWNAQDGELSLSLSALPGGGVSQTVSTDVGAAYTLTFWLSNPDPTGAARGLDVVVSTVAATNPNPNQPGVSLGTQMSTDVQWELRTVSFVATGTLTEIKFFTDPSGTDAGGPALDNVTLEEGAQVAPVPAPAGVVLAGIGGLGLAALRRRSRTMA